MPSPAPTAPLSATTASVSMRTEAKGSRPASRAAGAGHVRPGEAEDGDKARGLHPRLRRRRPRRREDARERAVGIGPDVRRAALTSAEDASLPVSHRRPAARAATIDSEKEPHGVAPYQTNAGKGILIAGGNRPCPSTSTEARHDRAVGIQALPPAEVLARLLDAQRQAAAAVAPAIPAIEAAAAAAAAALGGGGKLAYAGAGSAGLMALADALELLGTFGIPPERTPILFAGGAAALIEMAGSVEDARRGRGPRRGGGRARARRRRRSASLPAARRPTRSPPPPPPAPAAPR